jgi:hypothetical protein
MSLLIGLAGGAIKAVGAARMASRAAGLDTTALDDMHDGLRAARAHAREHELVANASSGQAAQPTDPGDTGDGDPAGTDDGFLSDVTQWIADRITDLF